jgi:solute carrier family 39 (zinc transporter), member 1/2/3
VSIFSSVALRLADSGNSSSGLLIYAALVDLLAEDFLSEEAQELMDKVTKIKAFLWVLAGGE